jgi:hypothetical protein
VFYLADIAVGYLERVGVTEIEEGAIHRMEEGSWEGRLCNDRKVKGKV